MDKKSLKLLVLMSVFAIGLTACGSSDKNMEKSNDKKTEMKTEKRNERRKEI